MAAEYKDGSHRENDPSRADVEWVLGFIEKKLPPGDSVASAIPFVRMTMGRLFDMPPMKMEAAEKPVIAAFAKLKADLKELQDKNARWSEVDPVIRKFQSAHPTKEKIPAGAKTDGSTYSDAAFSWMASLSLHVESGVYSIDAMELRKRH